MNINLHSPLIAFVAVSLMSTLSGGCVINSESEVANRFIALGKIKTESVSNNVIRNDTIVLTGLGFGFGNVGVLASLGKTVISDHELRNDAGEESLSVETLKKWGIVWQNAEVVVGYNRCVKLSVAPHHMNQNFLIEHTVGTNGESEIKMKKLDRNKTVSPLL